MFLHETGSRNPLGVDRDTRRVPFHPYYTLKDLVGVFVTIGLMSLVLLVYPGLFSEPENYIPANVLKTPAHIQPEWYFLWLYAILRAVPNKSGGVLALVGALLVLVIFPFLEKRKDSVGCTWCVVKQSMFWSLVGRFFLLTWLGSCPAEEPYISATRNVMAVYFLYFLVFPLWRTWVHPRYWSLSRRV